MKLWLISQTENTGYDVYDSAVVAAQTEEEARRLHPDNREIPDIEGRFTGTDWCSRVDLVNVEFIGDASPEITDQKVICASFNAG